MLEQKRWLDSRKKMLTQIKNQIFSLQGRDVQVDAYAKVYNNEFRGNWKKSDYNDLLQKLKKFKIILGGDFHSFSQSQRTHLRIIRDWPKDHQIVLALECVESKYQKHINDYLFGKISENQFLKVINWNKNWTFPWENYQPLFEFAKKNKILVYGINKYSKHKTSKSLKLRDLHAARELLGISLKHPKSTIYCLFGDLHLAKKHLPQKIEEIFGINHGDFVARVFLNSEKLFFKNRDSIFGKQEVLKHSENKYCIISSPPWIKWQSYLIHLEGVVDSSLNGTHNDYTDLVSQQAQVILADLGINRGRNSHFSNLSVYDYNSSDFVDQIAKKLNSKSKKIFLKLLEEEKSFSIPQHDFYFLSRLTINFSAHIAGTFIHNRYAKIQNEFWNLPEDFLILIWREAIAFFLSKFINPKRKSEDLMVLRNKLKTSEQKGIEREALSLVLNQKTMEWFHIHGRQKRQKKFRVKFVMSYFHAAKILGSMLGEKLFSATLLGFLGKNEILKLLSHNIEDKNKFSTFYFNTVKHLEFDLNLNNPTGSLK
jgi:hypothetical protein